MIEKLQELQELDIPYNYSIPTSLLKYSLFIHITYYRWIDKPADNNPDAYFNTYLSICEEISQIHKAKTTLRSVFSHDSLYDRELFHDSKMVCQSTYITMFFKETTQIK